MGYDYKNLSPADFEDLARDLIGRDIGVRFEAFMSPLFLLYLAERPRFPFTLAKSIVFCSLSRVKRESACFLV